MTDRRATAGGAPRLLTGGDLVAAWSRSRFPEGQWHEVICPRAARSTSRRSPSRVPRWAEGHRVGPAPGVRISSCTAKLAAVGEGELPTTAAPLALVLAIRPRRNPRIGRPHETCANHPNQVRPCRGRDGGLGRRSHARSNDRLRPTRLRQLKLGMEVARPGRTARMKSIASDSSGHGSIVGTRKSHGNRSGTNVSRPGEERRRRRRTMFAVSGTPS